MASKDLKKKQAINSVDAGESRETTKKAKINFLKH